MISIQFKGKLLVLRHFRLRRIPPAWNATEMLQEQGIPVLVVEFGHAREKVKELEDVFQRLRIANPWILFFPKKIHPLLVLIGTFIQISSRILLTGRPRLMVVHGQHEGILAVFLKFFFRIPYAIHAHEIFDKEDLSFFNRFLLKFEGQIFRAAAFVIFPEKSRLRLYRKRHHYLGRSFLVYNCPRMKDRLPEAIDLKRVWNLPPGARTLGYWGGIGDLNAIEEAVRALSLLPELYFFIWGWGDDSYLQKLKRIAREIGVEKRCLFLGNLEKRKWETLAGLDLGYCVYRPQSNLRSRYQATASNKLMESIMVGLPIISSRSPDFREVVEGEGIGVCVPRLSAAEIAHHCRQLLRDESALLKIKDTTRKLHLERFHYEAQFKVASKEFGKYFDLQEKSSAHLPDSLPLGS